MQWLGPSSETVLSKFLIVVTFMAKKKKRRQTGGHSLHRLKTSHPSDIFTNLNMCVTLNLLAFAPGRDDVAMEMVLVTMLGMSKMCCLADV